MTDTKKNLLEKEEREERATLKDYIEKEEKKENVKVEVKNPKEELLSKIGDCIKEYDGESNVPRNHEYWSWVNQYRGMK